MPQAQLYFLSDQYYQDFPEIIFPDVFKIYRGLEQQLQQKNIISKPSETKELDTLTKS